MADKKSYANQTDPLLLGAGLLAGAGFAAVGGWMLYSHLAINHRVALTEAIPAKRDVFFSRTAGRLSYYESRRADQRPLVLVHPVHLAGSAYEVRPLFMHYRMRRPVYALDLPGYGFSDRSERIYTPHLFEQAIIDLISTQVGEPADVVAFSLSSEFAARAALQQSGLIRSLAVISPTGFTPALRTRGPQRWRARGASDALHPLVSNRLMGRPIYDALTSHMALQEHYRQRFVGPVAPGLVDYAYATAHQPKAEAAGLYYLAGKLFTSEVRRMVYERVTIPSLAVYDTDPYNSFDTLNDLLVRNMAWQAVRMVPSQGMPQFERLADLVEVLEKFWAGIKD